MRNKIHSPGNPAKLVIILLFFGLSHLAVIGASPGIEVDVLVGFNGLFKPGRWTPVTVSVDNSGTGIRGELLIETITGSGRLGTLQSTRYVKPLELPRNSRKRYSFVIPLGGLSASFEVRIEEQGVEIFNRSYDLREHAVADRIVLGLSREVSLDFLTLIESPLSDSRIRIVYPHAEFLPEKWHGYDGVEMVVVHNINLKLLSNEQVEALDKWVSSGGILVVSGASQHTQTNARILHDLMPVDIIGRIELDHLDALSLRFGGEMPSGRKFPLSLSRPSDGTVLIRQDNVPLLVSGSRGRGTVIYMAFDYARYPIYGWPGKYSLWSQVLRESSTAEERGDSFKDSRVLPLLSQPLYSFPSHLILLVFIGGYIFIFIFIGKLGKGWLKSPWPRGVALAILAVAVSSFGYYIYSVKLFKGETLLLDISQVKVDPGQRHGEFRGDLLLLSSAKGNYGLSVEGEHVSIEQEGFHPLTIEENVVTSIRNIAMARWSTRLFRLDTIVNFMLEGSMERSGTFVRVELKNLTSRWISDGIFFYRGVPYFAGDVGPNDTIEDSFRYVSSEGTLNLSRLEEEQILDQHQEHLKEKLIYIEHLVSKDSFPQGGDVITFIGWLERPLVEITPDRPFLHRITISPVIAQMSLPGVNRDFG
jgi:hypothetical protein